MRQVCDLFDKSRRLSIFCRIQLGNNRIHDEACFGAWPCLCTLLLCSRGCHTFTSHNINANNPLEYHYRWRVNSTSLYTQPGLGRTVYSHPDLSSFQLRVSSDGLYSVALHGEEWLQSDAQTAQAIHCDDTWYAHTSGSGGVKGLQAAGRRQFDGTDALGSFTALELQWSTPCSGGGRYVTTFRVYKARSALVFAQSWPDGATGVALGSSGGSQMLSAFPSFTSGAEATAAASGAAAPKVASLRRLSWEAMWDPGTFGTGLQGYAGGSGNGVPLLLMDESLHTLALSPLTNFKVGGFALGAAPFATSAPLMAGLQGTVSCWHAHRGVN